MGEVSILKCCSRDRQLLKTQAASERTQKSCSLALLAPPCPPLGYAVPDSGTLSSGVALTRAKGRSGVVSDYFSLSLLPQFLLVAFDGASSRARLRHFCAAL